MRPCGRAWPGLAISPQRHQRDVILLGAVAILCDGLDDQAGDFLGAGGGVLGYDPLEPFEAEPAVVGIKGLGAPSV